MFIPNKNLVVILFIFGALGLIVLFWMPNINNAKSNQIEHQPAATINTQLTITPPIKNTQPSINDIKTPIKTPVIKNDVNVKTTKPYWQKIQEEFGSDIEALRDAIKNGNVDGLAIFNALKNTASIEDQSWFIDVMRNYDDESLFEEILKASCCEDEQLSTLVFKFSIEQFNSAATNALMNTYDNNLSQEQQDKILYSMGGATQYTAGNEINSTVVGWLEDKIYAQSSQSDIATVMAYFRATQGNPQLNLNAEEYLIDLFTDDNRLLKGNIRIEDHFKNTQPSKNLINTLKNVISSDQISTENKFALNEVHSYWTSLGMDSTP